MSRPGSATSPDTRPVVFSVPQGQVALWTWMLGLEALYPAGRPRAEPCHSYTPSLKCSDRSVLTVMHRPCWPPCVGKKQHVPGIMGVGAGKDPFGHEVSSFVVPSSLPWETLERFVRICFRITQAGSLPAIPLGMKRLFLWRKYSPHDWLGSFVGWLQPHPSWLVFLRPP